MDHVLHQGRRSSSSCHGFFFSKPSGHVARRAESTEETGKAQTLKEGKSEEDDDKQVWNDSVGYYNEELNIQTVGMDPATLGILAFGAIAFNFFILGNM